MWKSIVVLNRTIIFVETKQIIMKRKIREALELHAKANELLYLCNEMQGRIDTMLKYNIETAAPNNFIGYSDNQIDTCERGLDRLWRSYQIVIDKLKSLDAL